MYISDYGLLIGKCCSLKHKTLTIPQQVLKDIIIYDHISIVSGINSLFILNFIIDII